MNPLPPPAPAGSASSPSRGGGWEPEGAGRGPVAVYVHIPFCTIKCGYCDFNAYAGMQALQPAYAAALLRDVESWRPVLASRGIRSIGFGGGTPGEMPPRDIVRVVEALAAAGSLAPGAEVTLEANPGSTALPQLRELRAGGVTRVSFGVQSFDAAELRFLDRIHSPKAAKAAVPMARAAGFGDVNLDLIYGLPGQSLDGWRGTLRTAIALAPGHISSYCLTVEEGTPLARRVAAGEVTPADPDLAADMYDFASAELEAAGFVQYELSNWARPGHESRHNLVYWTDGDYLGIGAGAHGYLGGERYEVVAHPRAYIAAAARAVPGESPRPGGRPQVLRSSRPSPAATMADWLALRLRLVAGFAPREFEERFGQPLEDAVGPVIDECRAAGLLEREGNVRLSRRGRQLHSEVAVRLLAHLERPGT